MTQGDNPVISVNGARKSFGAVHALDGVDFAVRAGECVGLVGHNGAGKSTLVSILNGGLSPDSGTLALLGRPVERHSIALARGIGLRCVFQELSLCPNLTVTENTRVAHRGLSGFGWRRRAARLIKAKLDEIFPGNDIDVNRSISGFSIAQRQMIEIATAFTSIDDAVRLVVLDEPTSSLDAGLAGQLLAFVRRFVAAGGAVVLISHILGEVLSTTDRIVVMKDGKVVADRPSADFSTESLVGAMGSVVRAREGRAARNAAAAQTAVLSRSFAGRGLGFVARPGELIGLAGLAGHGQTRMLVDLYMAEGGSWRTPAARKVAFVAGDRAVDGNLPLWSIVKNMSVTLLPGISRMGLVDQGAEARLAADWHKRIAVRTENMDNTILSLSGGNQQKVLFARALASPAPVVLMDDPMRGVDIGTKQEVYAMLRAEAAGGRTFVWYSTEMDEVCQCDRVYVFREGLIVAELTGDEINEERILSASFAEQAT